jgi:hypothetical protein
MNFEKIKEYDEEVKKLARERGVDPEIIMRRDANIEDWHRSGANKAPDSEAKKIEEVPEERKIEEGGKFELLSKELEDKKIKENDLVKVWLSSKHHVAGPDGLYNTYGRGYFVSLTDEYLITKGYTFGNREVITKIRIEDVVKIEKDPSSRPGEKQE